MLRSVRFAVLLSLCLFAIASPSLGASPRGEGRALRAVAMSEWAAQALGRLWAFVAVPRQAKAGALADPHGACGTGPAPSCGQQQGGEAGALADPSGVGGK